MDQAASEVAAYFNLVKQDHPGVAVGDVEWYTGSGDVSGIESWIDALGRKSVTPPSFDLDVDFQLITKNPDSLARDIKTIQAFVEGKGIKFGLILTETPPAQPNGDVVVTDDVEFQGAVAKELAFLNRYSVRPSRILFTSWVKSKSGLYNIPNNGPDSNQYTLTGMVANLVPQLK